MRCCIALAIIAASAACGDHVASPTGPTTPERLPLQAGAYSVAFFGADAVGGGATGPIQPGCPGLGASGIGGAVFTLVDLQPEGSDWVGHATDGISTLVIRVRRGDGSPQPPRPGTRVVGSIAGVARNTSSPNPGDDVGRTVSFGGAGEDAALEGALPPTVNVPGGTVSGEATLMAADGRSVTCNAGTVSWSLSPHR